MRAGNVIGGGDFAVDRIIPDCIRAAIEGKDIVIRNPYAVRPVPTCIGTCYGVFDGSDETIFGWNSSRML